MKRQPLCIESLESLPQALRIIKQMNFSPPESIEDFTCRFSGNAFRTG
jgi:hypothetical protein